jgi:UPF0716 family protein affecting phage T7 exclusion
VVNSGATPNADTNCAVKHFDGPGKVGGVVMMMMMMMMMMMTMMTMLPTMVIMIMMVMTTNMRMTMTMMMMVASCPGELRLARVVGGGLRHLLLPPRRTGTGPSAEPCDGGTRVVKGYDMMIMTTMTAVTGVESPCC